MHNVKMINELILNTETVIHRYSVKKLFIEIRKIARVSFSILKKILLKKRLWHRYFAVNFVTFLINTFSYRTPLVAASENTRFTSMNIHGHNITEAFARRFSVEKLFLKKFLRFTGKHLCVGVYFLIKLHALGLKLY